MYRKKYIAFGSHGALSQQILFTTNPLGQNITTIHTAADKGLCRIKLVSSTNSVDFIGFFPLEIA